MYLFHGVYIATYTAKIEELPHGIGIADKGLQIRLVEPYTKKDAQAMVQIFEEKGTPPLRHLLACPALKIFL